MDYSLNLRTQEPCDIFLVVRDRLKLPGKVLLAIVVESRTAYSEVLDQNVGFEDLTLSCAKHKFSHQKLMVTVVEDFALVDGAACYESELSPVAKEVMDNALSCS